MPTMVIKPGKTSWEVVVPWRKCCASGLLVLLYALASDLRNCHRTRILLNDIWTNFVGSF